MAKIGPLRFVAIFIGVVAVFGLLFGSFLASFVVFGGAAFFGLLIHGANRIEARYRRRHPQMCKKSERRDLMTPDWTFYGEHLGRPVPDELKRLFASEDLVCRQNFTLSNADHDWSVTAFIPIRETELFEFEADDQEYGVPTHPIVPIAGNDLGDPIYLKPGKDQSDSVWVWEHELQKEYTLAQTVGEFVRGIKAL